MSGALWGYAAGGGIPLGSRDPNRRVLGSKYYSVNGMWDLKPHYLGLWILRDCLGFYCSSFQVDLAAGSCREDACLMLHHNFGGLG